MGAIASVFEIRCDPVGNKSFRAFRELMDVYVDLCAASLKTNKDFIDVDFDLSENEEARERLKSAFERIFGTPPGSV
jgi:hypothetical protein